MKPSYCCTVCGNRKGYQTIKHGVRDSDSLDVVECKLCGHVQIYPIPSIEKDKEFYDKDGQERSFVSNEEFSDNELREKYKHNIITYQFSRIKPYIQKSDRILEIGSGYGILMEHLEKEGYSPEGIEISAHRRKIARSHCKGNIYSINLQADEIPTDMERQYDVIFLFNVLEHISDLHIFIKSMKKILKITGSIILEVPNFDDELKALSANYNHFSYLRAHINYFKVDILIRLFQDLEFKQITIRGIQNYSFENAAHWISTGRPEKRVQQYDPPAGLEWLNDYYKNHREKQLSSDALLIHLQGIQ